MTYDKLKKEADKLGYNLIKKQNNIRFLPCVCGHNRRRQWISSKGKFYVCCTCGLRSPASKTEKGAKIAWNEMIEKMKGEKNE